MMDIYKAILELREEKKRLDRAIAALEHGGAPPHRRSWDSNARHAAAERMKKYWEQRKQQSSLNGAARSHSVSPPSTESV